MDFFGAQTPSYDTKMLLNVVINKAAFVKFMISNNFKQNIDEPDFKNLKKKCVNQTSRDFSQMFVISTKKPYPRVWI
jgi:hypothetical protein